MIPYRGPCPVHAVYRLSSAWVPWHLATGEPCTCMVTVISFDLPQEPVRAEVAKAGKPLPYWRQFERKKWGRE